jgi:hypothetical protein
LNLTSSGVICRNLLHGVLLAVSLLLLLLLLLLQEASIELLQNMSPKVEAASLAPAVWPEDHQLEW